MQDKYYWNYYNNVWPLNQKKRLYFSITKFFTYPVEDNICFLDMEKSKTNNICIDRR